MTEPSSERVHASCVAIGGIAVLLSGRSGCGKSDLALRLIDRGARLVSDDYTVVSRKGAKAVASAPETIRGRIEAWGVGIVDMADAGALPVGLIVVLDEPATRLPEPQTRTFAGIDLPTICLEPLEASAPIKVELALKQWGLR